MLNSRSNIEGSSNKLTDNNNNNDNDNDNTNEQKEVSVSEIAKSFHISENNIFGIDNNIQTLEKDDNHIVNNIKFSNIKFTNISDNDKFILENKPIQENKLIQKNKPEDISNKMFVTYSNNLFKFFDDTKRPIGNFSVDQVIKYIGESYDTKKQFMKNLQENTYKESKVLIKNFLCEIEYDGTLNHANISIKNHQNSPFMGDVEMIMNLNNLLADFNKNKLHKELEYVDLKNRGKIEQLVKQFNFMMLNYTIGLVNIVNDQIKGDPTKEALKRTLAIYSTNTVYKISSFVQNQLSIVVKTNEKLEKMLLSSIKLKSLINDKLNKLTNLNTLPLNPPEQQGGNLNSDSFKEISLSSLESDSQSSVELTHSVDSNFEYDYSDAKSYVGAINNI